MNLAIVGTDEYVFGSGADNIGTLLNIMSIDDRIYGVSAYTLGGSVESCRPYRQLPRHW